MSLVRIDKTLRASFKLGILHTILVFSQYGVVPKHHVLDNKCSKEFKEAIRSNGMTFQLADAHDHRRNVAEKAI